MSHFLVNLARRAAGVAPVLHAPRAFAVAPVGEDSGGASAPADTPVAAAPPRAWSRENESGEGRSTRIAPPAPAVAPAAPVAAAQLSPAPALVVQRELFTTVVPQPTSPSVAPAAATPEAAPVAAAQVVPRETATEPPVTAIRPAMMAEPSPAHLEPAAPWPVATPLLEPHHDRPPAQFESDYDVRPAPDWSDREISIPDRSVEPDSARERITTMVQVEPARPAALPIPIVASVDAAPVDVPTERVVHVRIGSLEIHAAQAAPAPAPPSAPAPPTAHAPSAGGFDEFVRLRNYAPWRW